MDQVRDNFPRSGSAAVRLRPPPAHCVQMACSNILFPDRSVQDESAMLIVADWLMHQAFLSQ